MTDPRRTFGPVVLAGLTAAGLAALAGTRPWVEPESGSTSDPLGLVADVGEVPLAGALALVVLACWGVVLVTRRRVRRAVAVVGLLAALGLLAAVVVGWVTLPDQVLDALASHTGERPGAASLQRTVWGWAAAAGAVGSVATTVLAVRWAPTWPEMGSRYDAPGRAAGSPGADQDAGDPSHLELWKAMDEGRDPTA